MRSIDALRSLDTSQRHTVFASFLGWTLDAFDYFLLVFVIPEVARDFHVGVTEVAFSLTVTLAMRPLGAWLFGRLADRYGRRPLLMVDVALFAVLEAASALAPSLAVLLVVRALFGVAMGGEWGIGASLAMESIPAPARGIVSGLLQEGYAVGYLVGALCYYALFDTIGWRGMFALGIVPALLVLYIRRSVPESPVWRAQAHAGMGVGLRQTLRGQWGKVAYLIVLMALFNAFSHGSQDLYPTFLRLQKGFDTHVIGALTVVLNLGAIAGGLVFGALSERIGRRRAIVAASLLALPMIPLWSHGGSIVLLGIGVFGLQVAVQGAWGVVPVHLNELSPDRMRGTLPGFVYQSGNLLAAVTAPLLTSMAQARHGDYGGVMAVFIAVVAIALAIVTALGPEGRGVRFGPAVRAAAGGS
ncbi:MAG: MFS transporter [Lysobacterales bacterium]